MTKEEIEKAYRSNTELGAEELKRITTQVAQTKRFVELIAMIPGAKELADRDPDAFHTEYGLADINIQDMKYLYEDAKIKELNACGEKQAMEMIPESIFRYKQFLGNKLFYRDKLREEYCTPSNPTMKKWRQRQLERCKGFAGQSYEANIHIPFNMELTDGCSVGCPFCAVGARKLQSIYRYTLENASLYQDILKVAHEIIGNAAGTGGLYYACEPLDNPDYELFAEDYYTEFKRYPQITTAIALRDVARTHRLLERLLQVPSTVHRFSMFSKEDTLQVMQEFSEEELLRVELLPQFDEAPAFVGFAKSGRELTAVEEGKATDCAPDESTVNSICCVSGFVVNMPRKTVRLITSINACEKYPTGEVVYEERSFQNSQEFRKNLTEMIEKHMMTKIPTNQSLKLYDYYTLAEDKEHGNYLKSQGGYHFPIDKMIYPGAKAVIKALIEGNRNRAELAAYLDTSQGVKPEHTYWLLTSLWNMGVINEFFY